MNTITTINNGKTIHAAKHDSSSGHIELYCNSLKYDHYFADIKEYIEPTKENVSCKKCLKKIS